MKELLELSHNLRLGITPDLQGMQPEAELIFVACETGYRLEETPDGLKMMQSRQVETFRASASIRRLLQFREALNEIISLAEQLASKGGEEKQPEP